MHGGRYKFAAAMDETRTEQAIRRIEAALSRIAEVADTVAVDRSAPEAASPAPDTGAHSGDIPASVSQLVVQHEALREEVAAQVRKLDEILERLDA